MVEVTAPLYWLFNFCYAYTTHDVLGSSAWTFLFTCLNYVFLSQFFTTVDLTDVDFANRFLGWYPLLGLIGALTGWGYSWLSLDNPKLLGLYRKPMIILTWIAMAVASAIVHIAYLKWFLPWNILVLAVGSALILAVFYIPTFRMVCHYWTCERNTHKTPCTQLQQMICNDYRKISMVGFYDEKDVGRVFFWFGLAKTVFALLGFFQYWTSALGTGVTAEMWASYIAAGAIIVHSVLVYIFLPKNPKTVMAHTATINNEIKQNQQQQ